MRRIRHRGAGRWSFSALLAAAVVVGAAGSAAAQDAEDTEKPPKPPSIFDFVGHSPRDPKDLHPPARTFEDRWRSIWGTLGTRYHLYPSQQAGPEGWPPKLHAGGMNYSIWRDPVTGWPEF